MKRQKEIIKSLLEMSPVECDISSWQRGFLESVLSQLERANSSLSFNQERILSEVCAQNTPERLHSIQEWKTSYLNSGHMQESFKVCVQYYSATGYFASIVTEYRTTKDYIPPEKIYKKVCENKYAKKVLQSHFSEPLYSEGSAIQIRKGNKINFDAVLTNAYNGGYMSSLVDYAIVLQSNAQPIHRAAKGSKIYRILPVGVSKSYYVHESDIKRARGIKK